MHILGAHGGHKMSLVLLGLELYMVVRLLWIGELRDSGSSVTAVSVLLLPESSLQSLRVCLKKLPIYLPKLLSVHIVIYKRWQLLLFHVMVAMCCIALYFNLSLLFSCPRNHKSKNKKKPNFCLKLNFQVSSFFFPEMQCSHWELSVEQWTYPFTELELYKSFSRCAWSQTQNRKKNETPLLHCLRKSPFK